MSVKEFLGGVRVLQPSAEDLRGPPPLWMFLTPSLTSSIILMEHILNDVKQSSSSSFS